MPVYLVIDTSKSMCEVETDLNQLFEDVPHELGAVPLVANRLQLGVITFQGHATELRPLAPVRPGQMSPWVRCDGPTNYAAAFELLRVALDRDIARLIDQGNSVGRPVVFMLTDDTPNTGGDWRQPGTCQAW